MLAVEPEEPAHMVVDAISHASLNVQRIVIDALEKCQAADAYLAVVTSEGETTTWMSRFAS